VERLHISETSLKPIVEQGLAVFAILRALLLEEVAKSGLIKDWLYGGTVQSHEMGNLFGLKPDPLISDDIAIGGFSHVLWTWEGLDMKSRTVLRVVDDNAGQLKSSQKQNCTVWSASPRRLQ
jgi:hypothetical protein